MLEASAHHHLKALLRREGAQRWPHHLSLSRLVARSLRRGDHTLIRLTPGCDPSWWISLLVPLARSDSPLALILSETVRRRLLRVEWPRLQQAGLQLPVWEGREAPAGGHLWLLSHADLLEAWQEGRLEGRQLVIPEAERLERALREALAVRLTPANWDSLRRAHPGAGTALLELHGRLSRRVLAHPGHNHGPVALRPEEEAPLRQLLPLLAPLPAPWQRWLNAAGDAWSSWAVVDSALLQWTLHRQPLEPLRELQGLLNGRGAVLIGELAGSGSNGRESSGNGNSALALGLQPQVSVALGDPPLADPLPLYAPRSQPLPNSPHFAEHLLEHSRRLVLGQSGLSVVLVDDSALRRGLTSALAAEFGSRVQHESTAPESNGVICCRWDWWLEHQPRLPQPCQLVVGLLPIASLEDPLTAARVAAMRRQGRDWFRELLLPEALNRLQRSLTGLRRAGGRLAVLDGRLRARSWGAQVLGALEPWVQLTRLLPG
ncbi:MAG: helicase [Synechococcaceae cyanobacterium]|nr:helicase [Synechococcaceae cyanobacterium]